MRPVPSGIGAAIIGWQRRHGRHDLPWQGSRDPYPIWVSEIMLQQTQVAAVIPFYQRFVARLPNVGALADADLDTVLRLWSGLGYYGRARNMHRCARQIVHLHAGRFPRSARALAELPGIGRSTAAAIAVFAFGERAAILDGNVKRVFARRFGIEGYPGASAVERRLWALAEQQLPARDLATYTQGLMDLGATVCTRTGPRCARCPLAAECVARIEGRTDELPHRRPARSMPQRATAMLLIECDGRLLLERRPPEGVWGGLWSLPEVPDRATAAQASTAAELAAEAVRRFGLRIAAIEPLDPFEHRFTHFRLHVEPWRIVAEDAARACAPGALWLEPDEAMQAALPQPVRRLLRSQRAGRPQPRAGTKKGRGAGR